MPIYGLKKKTLEKIEMEEKFLNLIKSSCKNPTVDVIFNGACLNVCPKDQEQGGMPFSSLIFLLLDEKATAIRQEKEIKDIEI